MYRHLISSAVLLFSTVALAEVEDGTICFVDPDDDCDACDACIDRCDDNVDNDGDGLIDCDEVECRSSSPACTTAVDGPIAVGLGGQRPLFTFDKPMHTFDADNLSAPKDLLVLDVNGVAAGGDDLVIPNPGILATYRNISTPGYVSLPSVRTTTAMTGLTGALRGATGDLNADGRSDLVLVNATSTRRLLGNGHTTTAGTYTVLSTTTGTGLPAVAGRSAAVASTRLRIYDQRCTAAGGLVSGDTFSAGTLCSSVDLPGTTTNARKIVGATVGSRNYFLTVVGNDVTIHEALNSTTPGTTIISAALRSTTTMSGIVDVAWSAADQAFIFAFADRLEVRGLTSALGVANLTVLPALPAFVPFLAPPPAIAPPVLARIAVGPLAPSGGRSVVVTYGKDERVDIVPFSTTSGWNELGIVRTSIDTNPATQQLATAIAIGHFASENHTDDPEEDATATATERLDIAFIDEVSSRLIILRQQPDPCMGFVVSSSHGMLAFGSPYPEIARFNQFLKDQLVEANAARRPANSFRNLAGLTTISRCPVELKDVRGNWERLSGQGTGFIVVGRGGWTVASLLILAPGNVPFIPARPAFTPVGFAWSAFFLPVDFATKFRFGTAGVATVGEIIGRWQAGAGSRIASSSLNAVTRLAINDVNARLDRCSAPIFVDYIGHSRGGPVVQDALRSGFGPRSGFNFEVSTTLIDAPDMSPFDMPRPWMRAGYIVGDPRMLRVGSEWNSSFFTHNSAGEIDALLRALPVDAPMIETALEDWGAFSTQLGPYLIDSPVDEIAEFVRSEVVGLPRGRDREAELEEPTRSFGAYQGPLGNVRHRELLGDGSDDPDDDASVGYGLTFVAPDGSSNINAPHPTLTDASAFSFSNVTHFGTFLANPRNFDASFAVGFHRIVNAGPTQELGHLPVDCGGTGTGTTAINDEDGRASRRRDGAGRLVRELVGDFDFRLLGALVENSREIIGGVPTDPDLKETIPSGYEPLRDLITTTAATSWVAGGHWQRNGIVSLIAALPSLADELEPFTAIPGPDDQEWDAEQQAWAAELNALTEDALFDASDTIANAGAHLTSAADARVRLGSTTSTISTELHPASLSSDELLVRIEYDLLVSSGTVGVTLEGPGLAASATWTSTSGTTRRVAQLIVNRSAWFLTGSDKITVSGQNVDIFAVSVRSGLPQAVASSDSLYEFVALDHGVAPARAAHLAARSRFAGRQGRLARFSSTDVLDDLTGSSETLGWVDGASATGEEGTFVDGDEQPLDALLFGSAGFAAPRPRGAQAFTTLDAPMRLGQIAPATTYKRQPMGFWVEYPDPASAMAKMARSVASFFGSSAVEADDTDATCLSLTSLDCVQ